jgi:hypothetical protein
LVAHAAETAAGILAQWPGAIVIVFDPSAPKAHHFDGVRFLVLASHQLLDGIYINIAESPLLSGLTRQKWTCTKRQATPWCRWPSRPHLPSRGGGVLQSGLAYVLRLAEPEKRVLARRGEVRYSRLCIEQLDIGSSMGTVPRQESVGI